MSAHPSDLALARRIVLDVVRAAAPGERASVFDEDTLMRTVPFLEQQDPDWLTAVLADGRLAMEGRRIIRAYTLRTEPPAGPGQERD